MTKKHQSPEAHLTRAELAKAIGKSKTTIRRWEEQGKLKPIVGPHRVRLYRVADAESLNGGAPVETLPRARTYVPTAPEGDGELAAQIFELLEQDVHPVEIISKLRVHPDVVEYFAARWARMRGTIFLNTKQLQTLTKFFGIKSFRDVEDLTAQIKSDVVSLTTCEDCSTGSQRRYCDSCFHDAVEAARVRATLARWVPGPVATHDVAPSAHRTKPVRHSSHNTAPNEQEKERRPTDGADEQGRKPLASPEEGGAPVDKSGDKEF